MKRKISAFLVTVFLIIAFIPQVQIKAAGLTLSGVPSSVKIGDTFSVTVTSPAEVWSTVTIAYDANIVSFVSASTEMGGGSGSIFYTDFTSAADSVTITFKALSAGETTISVTSSDAELSDGQTTTVSGASKTVIVANAATEEENTNKSGDNSLSSLVLSSGTLSPSFAYNTTNYTATVDYNVTKIAITAKTSNEKAKIESITGNENLSVGKNTIKIVVKAENGVTATYTIVVTRKAEEQVDVPEQPAGPVEDVQTFTVNGQTMVFAEEIPDNMIPMDFSKSTITLGGKDYPCLTYNHGDLTLLYLVDESGQNGGFYVYDANQNAVYSFVALWSEKGYVMVLLPDVDEILEGYSEHTLSIESKGVVTAYQSEQSLPDFYLLYCMNSQGELGWYQYDLVEGTYQRYQEKSNASDEISENEKLSEEDMSLSEEVEILKRRNYFVICVFVLISTIQIIIIVSLLIARIRKVNEDDELYDEFEEDNEEIDSDDDMSNGNESDIEETDEEKEDLEFLDL